MATPISKTIVITGASAGIGATLARQAASRGARVVLAARREAELNAVATACGADALAVPTDVTRREAVERLRDQALARFGAIDVWVNNAGRGLTKMPSELTDDDIDVMIRDNVKSALYGMQAVLPHFKARGTGHAINVSSMLGRVPFATFRSAYCAAKHALNAITATLRCELRAEYPGIHVSLFSPGVVATEFGVNSVNGGPDSRTLPGAQPVEDAAGALLELIEHPRADAYSRAGLREMAAAYFAAEDMGAVEADWPGIPRR